MGHFPRVSVAGSHRQAYKDVFTASLGEMTHLKHYTSWHRKRYRIGERQGLSFILRGMFSGKSLLYFGGRIAEFSVDMKKALSCRPQAENSK